VGSRSLLAHGDILPVVVLLVWRNLSWVLLVLLIFFLVLVAIQVLGLFLSDVIGAVYVKAPIAFQQETLAFNSPKLNYACRPLITHSLQVLKLRIFLIKLTSRFPLSRLTFVSRRRQIPNSFLGTCLRWVNLIIRILLIWLSVLLLQSIDWYGELLLIVFVTALIYNYVLSGQLHLSSYSFKSFLF